MSLSLLNIFSALLPLFGFSVNPNANTPSSSELNQYAPKHADFTAYLNVQAVLPNNHSALKRLVANPAIRSTPQLRQLLENALQQLDIGLSTARTTAGINMLSDIDTITAWLQYQKQGPPAFLVAVRGRFPANCTQKLTSLGAKTTTVAGKRLLRFEDMTLFQASSNTFLIGSHKWVRARVKKKYRHPRAKTWFHKLLAKKPFFVAISSPSSRMRRGLLKKLKNSPPPQPLLRDFIKGHRFAALTLNHLGMNWHWHATSKASFRRAKQASEGFIQLLRASQFALRGMGQILFSILESYIAPFPNIQTLLNHQDLILAFIDQFTGPGDFKVNKQYTPDQRSIAIHTTGHKLSDVIGPILIGTGFLSLLSLGGGWF